MKSEKYSFEFSSTCIPIRIDNCNTDLIIPARYLSATTRDPKFFGGAFMRDLRYTPEGIPAADFVLNRPPFSEPPREGVNQIIVAGDNWGSGSSREHAAWAIAGYGIRAIITCSIADIHLGNLLNCFVLPIIVTPAFQQELFASIDADPQTRVHIDLSGQTVTNLATGHSEHFPISAYKKYCLMNGLDDIDFLLKNIAEPKAVSFRAIFPFVFAALLLLCSCHNNKTNQVNKSASQMEMQDSLSTKIKAEMAYEGINNYCHEEYDWSAAEDNPDMMSLQMGEETETEYEVVFRSYTGAFVHFYVNKTNGITRIVEKVPDLGVEEEAGTINLFDHLKKKN